MHGYKQIKALEDLDFNLRNDPRRKKLMEKKPSAAGGAESKGGKPNDKKFIRQHSISGDSND